MTRIGSTPSPWMSIRLYLISKDDIKHKLRDFIENYSDLNGHFLESEVNKDSLLTVHTDLGIENLAFELQIPVVKLNKIDQSSRRKSPIKLTLFSFDDVNLEVSEYLVGTELYKQYNFLKRNHQKKIQESLNRSRNQRTIDKRKLDTSSRVKEETVYYSEEDLIFTEEKMDLSGIPEFLIPSWNTKDENGLEDFISALESAMEIGVTKDVKTLIYCAMVKSDRSSLLEGLTTELESLEAFSTWLRERFGPTPSQQRSIFQSMRQKPTETEVDFFIRLEKAFFQSRGMKKPTGNGFTEHMKADIQYAFMTGLKNREVKRLLWVNTGTLKYEDLPTMAKSYACAIEDVDKVYNIEPASVNRVVGLERKLGDIKLEMENQNRTKPKTKPEHRESRDMIT